MTDTLPDREEQRRKSRRLDTGELTRRAITSEEKPPRVRPKWNILERQKDANKIAELERKIEEMEQEIMQQEKSLVITQYGDAKDLTVVKERVSLAPYAHDLNDAGRAMVAQICWMLDWNPFFDLHPFINKKGKLCLVPDYKKLISMAKEQQRLNDSSRPMTDVERNEHGLTPDQIGYVTEVKEVDSFLEFARAGVADQYAPVVGYGIYTKGERVPTTWTPAMLARKRSQRHAFGQLGSYKIVSKRFQDALMQIGALSVDETGDGFEVEVSESVSGSDAPQLVNANHFWGDTKQRQRFWISTKAISKKKAEVATALKFKIEDPEDSAQWTEDMAQFPDLENAIAYVNVVAENVKQESDAPTIIDAETGEVIKTAPAVSKCETCKERNATGEGPFKKMCALCATKAADAEAQE